MSIRRIYLAAIVPLHRGKLEHPQNTLPALLPLRALRITMGLEQTGHKGVLLELATFGGWVVAVVVCLDSGFVRLIADTKAAKLNSIGRKYCAAKATPLNIIGSMLLAIWLGGIGGIGLFAYECKAT